MPKIYDGSLQWPSMKILLIECASLRNAWKNMLLSGHQWRLYHNDAGGAGVYLNGKKFEMKPDKIYLISPQCELRTWVDGNPRQIYIHFEMDRLTGRSDFLCNELELTPPFAEAFRKIDDLLKSPDKSVPWRLTLQAFQLAAGVLESLSPEMLCEPDFDERIARVRNHMSNAPAGDFTLENMAKEAGMSPNAFLIRFKEVTGVTPHQYLLSIRYTAAARLLKDGLHDIDEVCEIVGVKDRFHFSRRFKQLYGMSPGAYRRS